MNMTLMHQEPATVAVVSGRARQIIHIVVRDGYRPALIEAQAGVPLRMIFHRDETEACSARVVFSSPRIDRRLASGVATVVDLPAQAAGEVRYTCGMGRYRGRIRFQEARGTRSRLRRFVAQRQGGLGVGVLVGLCGLPLVVLLVGFLFGAALWPAMGIALLAWLAGCLLVGSLLEHDTERTGPFT
jgi:plastocyanin domain-containing protein